MWDYFDDVAELLGGSARVVRWDQRGCGRSERSGPYSIAQSVADLDAIREEFAGPRTAVLGHSWGAHLALRYAIDHPERVTHVIYVSGTGVDADRAWHPYYKQNLRRRLGNDVERLEALGLRERAVLQWSADFADPGTALRQAERLATPWLGVNYECNAAINAEVKQELGNVAAQCRTLAVPVLIIDGTEDIRPRWAVDSLYETLPTVERVSLVGAGHLPWVERGAEFAQAVTSFLSSPRD
jgi:proline iminopeptidase